MMQFSYCPTITTFRIHNIIHLPYNCKEKSRHSRVLFFPLKAGLRFFPVIPYRLGLTRKTVFSYHQSAKREFYHGFTGLIGSIAFSVSAFRPIEAYAPVRRNREIAIPLSAEKKSQRSRLYYRPTIMSLLHCVFIAKILRIL
jgi:hypothetical protein